MLCPPVQDSTSHRPSTHHRKTKSKAVTQLQRLQGDLWRELGAPLQAKKRHLTHTMVKSKDSGDFPGGPVVRVHSSTAGGMAWVQFLVGELKPCMLCGESKNTEQRFESDRPSFES